MDRIAANCNDFELPISLEKTQAMGNNVDEAPSITNYELETV